MKKVVIIGAGCLGREILWLLEDSAARGAKIKVAGFIDDSAAKQGKTISSAKVLGPLSWLKSKRGQYQAVIAVGSPAQKRQIAQKLKSFGVKLFTVVHQSCVTGKGSSIGEGSVIFPQVVLSVNVKIGRCVLLNPGITLSHDVEIGEFSLLGSGAHLAGQVKVGAECEIGTGASIRPEIRIGARSIVGVGAAVVKDLPAGIVAVGVPARPLKK